MTSLFRCPVCGAPLEREDRVCHCPNRHSYDIAREGYTYLLPPNQKHSAAPGDDRGMAAARRDFLSKGYYTPLLNTLCCQILSLSGDSPVIWDVGCGEGYYPAGIYQALPSAGRSPRMAGTDVRYDYNVSRHYHVHCRCCGRVADLDMPAEFPMPVSPKDACGFLLEDFRVEYSGVCPRCREKAAVPC